MRELNINKIGIIVGFFFVVWHLIWSLIVAFGFAQVLIDWIFRLHFLKNPYQVIPFDFTTASLLIIFTFIVGYLFGVLFATVWNYFVNRK